MTTDKTYTLAEAAEKIGCNAGILMECVRREVIRPQFPFEGYYRCKVISDGYLDEKENPKKDQGEKNPNDPNIIYLTPNLAICIDFEMGEFVLEMQLQSTNPSNVEIIHVRWTVFVITAEEFDKANDFINSKLFNECGGKSYNDAREKWHMILIDDFENYLKNEIENCELGQEKHIFNEVYIDSVSFNNGISGYKKMNHYQYITEWIEYYLDCKFGEYGKSATKGDRCEKSIYKIVKNEFEALLKNKPQDFEAWLKDRLAQEIEAEDQEQTLMSDAALGRQLREQKKSFGRKAAEENRSARQPEWDRWIKEANRRVEEMLLDDIKPKGHGRCGNRKLPSYKELAKHVQKAPIFLIQFKQSKRYLQSTALEN